MSLSKQYADLKTLVIDLADDVAKVTDKKNKTAGLRIRKQMMEARTLTKDIRDSVTKELK